jgi:hypothetical protein
VDGLAVEAELGATVLGRAYRSRENGRTTRVLVLDREDYAWLLRTRYRESRVNVGVPGVRKLGTATAGARSWVSSELEAQTLGEGPVEPVVALEAVKRACRVVAAAHEQGRFHGLITVHDIEASGEVSGFGLAEVARRLAADLYEAHVARAPSDVAPEVRKADRTPATASTDVYGLGRALANALGSALQGDLAAIVARATSEAPEERHRDAKELLAALGRVTLAPAAVPLEPFEKGVLGSTKLVPTHEFGFDDDSAIIRPARSEPAPPPPPAPPAPAKAPPPKAAPPKPTPATVAAHDAVADVLKHIESLDKDDEDGERVGSITGHLVIPKGIVSDAEIDSGDILGDDFESLEDVRASKKRDGKSGRKKKPFKQSDAELAALGDLNALPPLDDLVSDVSPLASGPNAAMPSGLEGGNVKAAFDDPNASGPYSPNPFGDPLAAPPPPPPPPQRPKKNTASSKTKATGWASDDTFGALPGKAPDIAGFDPFGAPPQADPFGAPPQADPFAPAEGFGAPPSFGAPDPFGAPQADPFSSPDPFGAPPAFGAPQPDPFGAPPAFGAPGFDPFSAPQPDPFSAPQQDPFGAPQADPFGAPPAYGAPEADPFGAPPAFGSPGPDPFGAPPAFGAPGADPFGAPPAFGAPGPDPFGAPPAFGAPESDPFGAPPAFGAPGPDPFGAPPAFGAPGPDPFGAPPAFGSPQPDPFGAPPPGFGAPDPFAAPGGGFGAPELDPFASPAEPFAPGGDPFGAAPGGFDPFGAPAPATPSGDVPFDPYGKTLGPGQGLAKAAQDESFDPFSEPAPAGGFDPFGAPQAPRGPSMDPFDSVPLAGRPPTPRGQPRPGMPPQQDALLPPISSERQAFVGSKDADPFSGDEPELDAPAPPPAGAKKTRVMPGAGGGNCGLTIMGLVGKKKDRAADIVARIRGIPKAEAVDIVKGNIAKVLENVSRADAEKAAALFQAEGLQAKITEKK